MFPAARILDPITHDLLCPSGIIGPGVPVPCPLCAAAPVIIEGMPAAHVLCSAVCTGVISAGLAHPPPPPPAPPPDRQDRQRCSSTDAAARWFPAPRRRLRRTARRSQLAATRTVLIGG